MTIVVGYVPTREGEVALARAGEEARLRHAPLVVVSSTRGESRVAPDLPQTSALQMSIAEHKAAGVDVEVRHLEQVKDPAEAITSVAEEVKASLIVLGAKRRSPVGKLLLGSTVQRVLLDTDCAVLVVKP